MSHLSAHVLDAAAGAPATKVTVELASAAGELIASARTDADGRVADLGPDHLEPGDYKVTFGSGDYFTGRATECFYPAVTETKKWVVESPGLTETFRVYEELAKNKLLPTEALLNPEPWQPTKYVAFPEGKLPVAAQGTWGWRYDWGPQGATPIPGLLQKVSTWQYPSSAGQPYAVSGVGFSYEVSAKTKHPDEAVELAKWLSAGKPMAEQLTAVGAVAPRSGVDNIAPYSKETPLIEAGKTLATARSFPARPGQDQVAQAIAEATEGILTGKMDAAAAAKAFADNATELLGPDKVETSGT